MPAFFTKRMSVSWGMLSTALLLLLSSAHAQDRDVRAQRLVLDDNSNNKIIINTAAGPITGGTLTIPDPAGTGQFLISTPSGGMQSAFGHLLPGTDNLYDLGSGASRWRHLFLSGNLQLSGSLRLVESGGTDYTEFTAQAQANNITYTLPATTGTAGQVLRIANSPAPTSSTATLEWGAAGGSGWALTGNSGTTAGTDFVGTTDNQAFEIHLDEAGTATEGRRRVMRYEPNATSANIIGGFNTNSVTAGVVGAVIAGGGLSANTNRVTDDFGVVSGGRNNRAGDNAGTTSDAITATVSGGIGNVASGGGAAIGGGGNNGASGVYATIGGGTINTASATSATVSGGLQNTASAAYSTVAGGNTNSVAGDYAAIPGGRGLTLDASADRSFGFHANNSGGTRNMTISAADVALFGNTDLWLANNDNAPSELRFFEAYNTSGAFPSTANYTAFKAQTQANDITYTLPAANGTDGQVLRLATGATSTAGTLEWATVTGGLTLPFSNTTSSASTLFDITNSGSGQASNFNISGAKTASTTTMVVDNDGTNTTTDAINKTVLSVTSSGDFSGSGGGSTTAVGVDINMTGTGGDLNRGMKIAVAGSDAVGLQISSGRLVYSVASVAHPSAAFTAPNNAAIIKVTDNGTNSGNANLTLSTTDIIEGQVIWVYNGDTNDNVIVQSTPTRTINSGATNRDLWPFIYIDGAWRPLR